MATGSGGSTSTSGAAVGSGGSAAAAGAASASTSGGRTGCECGYDVDAGGVIVDGGDGSRLLFVETFSGVSGAAPELTDWASLVFTLSDPADAGVRLRAAVSNSKTSLAPAPIFEICSSGTAQPCASPVQLGALRQGKLLELIAEDLSPQVSPQPTLGAISAVEVPSGD